LARFRREQYPDPEPYTQTNTEAKYSISIIHQNLGAGTALIEFRAGSDGKDMDAAYALAAHWLRPFDTVAEAAKFGNTANTR
jgi:hypothetical protein